MDEQSFSGSARAVVACVARVRACRMLRCLGINLLTERAGIVVGPSSCSTMPCAGLVARNFSIFCLRV